MLGSSFGSEKFAVHHATLALSTGRHAHRGWQAGADLAELELNQAVVERPFGGLAHVHASGVPGQAVVPQQELRPLDIVSFFHCVVPGVFARRSPGR